MRKSLSAPETMLGMANEPWGAGGGVLGGSALERMPSGPGFPCILGLSAGNGSRDRIR